MAKNLGHFNRNNYKILFFNTAFCHNNFFFNEKKGKYVLQEDDETATNFLNHRHSAKMPEETCDRSRSEAAAGPRIRLRPAPSGFYFLGENRACRAPRTFDALRDTP
jgi:hypothetical protein